MYRKPPGYSEGEFTVKRMELSLKYNKSIQIIIARFDVSLYLKMLLFSIRKR